MRHDDDDVRGRYAMSPLQAGHDSDIIMGPPAVCRRDTISQPFGRLAMNTVLRNGKPVERMRYTGYIILHMHGKPMACPRISANQREPVREYVRQTALWIKRNAQAQVERYSK